MAHFLYRFFKDGKLLYVGETHSTKERFRRHRKEAKWWEPDLEVTVEFHRNARRAKMAERVAVFSERPIHNVLYRRS